MDDVYPIMIDGATYRVTVANGIATTVDGVYNVKAYGAVGDGVTDDTAAISNAVAGCNAANGSTLLFPPGGEYVLSSDVTISCDRINVSCHGATIIMPAAYSIIFSGSSDSRIAGATFVGDEELSTYSDGDFNPCVHVLNSENISVDDVYITGRSGGVHLDHSDGCSVTGVRLDGILDGYTGTGSGGTAAVFIESGTNNSVTDCVASNHGECVLVGSGSTYCSVVSCHAVNMYDNGFYFSTGRHNTISSCSVNGSDGTGVKMRGNWNTVTGNSIAGCTVGVVITGDTAIVQTDGTDGVGNVVSGNSIDDCSAYGVYLTPFSNRPPRGVIINGNSITGTPNSLSGAAIRVNTTTGGSSVKARSHSITGNTIDHSSSVACNYAVDMAGVTATATIEGCIISGNTIKGNGSYLSYGIRGSFLLNSSIYGNSYTDIGTASVLLTNSDACTMLDAGA